MKWWVERQNDGSYFICCEVLIRNPYLKLARFGYRLPHCYYIGEVANGIEWIKRQVSAAGGAV